ncbi:ZP3 protein, partial [Himantopus himantopus]|nr:ZP3 protein [Himantopus himantopus]
TATTPGKREPRVPALPGCAPRRDPSVPGPPARAGQEGHLPVGDVAGGGALPAPRDPVTPLEDALWRRTGSISSGAVQPTWVPFGSTVAHRRRLRFALDAYDSTWSSRLQQPTYSLGELINIQASVSTDPRLPLMVFVDECVASPSAAAWLQYKVIADNG